MNSAMTSRERFIKALMRQKIDKVPKFDQPWRQTIDRWNKEGLHSKIGVSEYFEYDAIEVFIKDLSFRLPEKTIEETDKYVIVQNSNGVVTKCLKDKYGHPAYLDFTINTKDKYYEYRHLLKWDDSRINWEANFNYQRIAVNSKKAIMLSFNFGFEKYYMIFGPNTMLMSLLEDPEWIADVVMTDINLTITAVEVMLERGLDIDCVFAGDDMGFKTDTLFSPECYKEIIMPAHKRFCDFCHSKNLPVILHSDGNIKKIIPLLIEAGFDCIQPLEVKAGMDLIQLKRDYGEKISFMGGIDARVMAKGNPDELEEEIKKIEYAKIGGGYIYHSDHSVPDDVSFKTYCLVMELVDKYGRY